MKISIIIPTYKRAHIVSEAIKHIDEFLDGDPEMYKTNINMGDKSILEILEGIGNEGEKR